MSPITERTAGSGVAAMLIPMLIGLVIWLAIMAVVIYLVVLLIKALRKYLRSGPVRQEKAEMGERRRRPQHLQSPGPGQAVRRVAGGASEKRGRVE